LPSMQGEGLQKYFFFPGFELGTGGLLREGDLLDRREAFQRDPHHREALLGSFGIAAEPGAQLISLFAYENAAIAGWLKALATAEQPIQLLVPEGRVLGDVGGWLGEHDLQPGAQYRRGNLH